MLVRPWALSLTLCLALPLAPAAPAAASAAAAPDAWGPVHRLQRDTHGQSMVVDGRGFTTVALGSQRGWPEPVVVARRTPRGRWLPTTSLGEGYDPVVAATPGGDLVAAWLRDRQDHTTGVWAARKPVGRPWTRPVHVSHDVAAPGYPDGGDAYGATGLDLAVRPDGAALLAWSWGSPERSVPLRIQAVQGSAAGTWSGVQAMTPASGATAARTAFGRDGTAYVAYRRPAGIAVRSRHGTAAWSTATRVGGGDLGDLAASRGDMSLVFRTHGRVRAATLTARGWSAGVPVTPAGVRVRDWSVATSPRGAAVVAYLYRHDRVDVVWRAPGGSWTDPTTLADPDHRLAGVTAAIDRAGDAFVVWDDSYGLWGRARPAGEDWHPETTAQADTGQVDVLESVAAQVAPNGDAVLLWEQEERPLRVRVLDVS